jgi:hypothetical protein
VQLEVVPQESVKVPSPPKPSNQLFSRLQARRSALALLPTHKGRLPGSSTKAPLVSNALFAVSNVLHVNPHDPNAALRARLTEASREQSAKWLARELGYKDHKEHQRALKIKELQRKAMFKRAKEQGLTGDGQKKEEPRPRADSEDEDEDYKPPEVRKRHVVQLSSLGEVYGLTLTPCVCVCVPLCIVSCRRSAGRARARTARGARRRTAAAQTETWRTTRTTSPW